jgi:hypothetical protein
MKLKNIQRQTIECVEVLSWTPPSLVICIIVCTNLIAYIIICIIINFEFTRNSLLIKF